MKTNQCPAPAECFPLAQGIKDRFHPVVREALYEVVESEMGGLCGSLYYPDPGSTYRRGGSAAA